MKPRVRTRLSTVMRGLAALLIVLQGGVDAAIAVAHATDPVSGPVAIESQHTANCVILHDAARCVQCQHHTTRMLSAATRRLPPTTGHIRIVARADRQPRVPDRLLPPATRPRAPPLPLS